MSTLASYLDLELIGPSGPVQVPGDLALPTPAEFAAIYRGPAGPEGPPPPVVVVENVADIPAQPPAGVSYYVKI